jgi:hypothetical protein
MAINFSIGEVLIPNVVYVDKTLAKFPSTPTIKQSLEILGALAQEPSTVAASGTTSFPVKSYIRVVPNDTSHRFYNKGLGVNVYFANDERLNNSFEFSTAFIKDKCFLKVLNSSGSPITKDQIVRQTGFDPAVQLATIALADATTDTNAVVFGITVEDIADGATGSILTDGSVQIDTSAYSIGDSVFLSNTPGSISATAGTVFTTVGRVLTVGVDGTMSMFSSLTGNGSGSGFFTDGTGTNAAIGKGATAPIASGINSFAHGDNSSATGPNTFAQGQNCAVNSAINTFVQGYDCIADIAFASYDSFAQGNNCVVGPSGFSQGTNIANYGSWTTFAQGHSIYIESYGSYNTFGTFAQGYNQTISNSTAVLSQGYTNSITSNSTSNTIRNALVQGENNTIYATADINNLLLQGKGNSSAKNHTFVQGESNTISSSHSFAQGQSNTINRPYSFAQGKDILIDGYGALAGYTATFAQGRGHTIRGDYGVFVQGYDNTVETSTALTFTQGSNNTMATNANACFAQGFGNYVTSNASFAQGTNNYVKTANWPGFAQGFSCNVTGDFSFAQGMNVTVSGSSSFAQGGSNSGPNTTVLGDVSFAQGLFTRAEGDRSFAQGLRATARRDDQKTWGSNRGSSGAAQKSRIVKYLNTANATPVNIVTLDLEEDKSYSLRILLIARNTTTNGETASFTLSQATTYRDTAGAAVLVSSPVALTGENSGGGAASWSARLLSSGNNVLLEVTGDGTDSVQWCADFEFVEVAG